MITTFLLTLALATPALEPVIVAVDSSRSLTPAELTTTHDALHDVIEALPGDTPVGLIAFHDRAEWLIRPTGDRKAVVQAMAGLKPTGDRTVLFEALILASQELPRGGVVLVITDGRDEGSAVTAEDVERRFARVDARIVTASVGRHIDDRSLRRLALLTQGQTMGRFDTRTPSDLIDVITALTLTSPPETAAASAPPQPVATAPREDAARSEATPSRLPEWTTTAAIAAVALLGLLAITSAVVRLRSHDERAVEPTCPTCGAALESWETSCSSCEIAALEDAARTRQVDTGRHDAGLTMAVANLGYLVLETEEVDPRRFALPPNEVFTVGRAPEVNSLQVEDPTVSAQHFKVVPKEDHFYVVDLDTTNGTTVNHERVRVRRLAPGDVIRAGLCEFRFELSKGTVH